MKRKYWVGLSLLPGVGSVRIKHLLDRYNSPERVWKLTEEELLTVPGFKEKVAKTFVKAREEIDLDRFLQYCKEEEICLLCPEDSEFPANLKHIYDPPPVIYYRGSIKLEDQHSIAIVGSRKMTPYGKRVTAHLSRGLAVKGFTVVSGMALGVDGVAHEAALEAGGRTIAVLGSGVDVIYPREHTRLYHEIQRSGAVVSTVPPGSAPERWHFPARNRIISGLSLGTVVIEAGKKSGALITADQALEQNREVFAVPGPIFSPMSEGTNDLIQKGAKLVTNADDIIDELGFFEPIPLFNSKQSGQNIMGIKAQSTDVERQIIALLEPAELTFDELINQTGLSTAELNTVLFELELKGIVSQYPGLKFALN